jgi:predicted protein tyrosine phosphatase
LFSHAAIPCPSAPVVCLDVPDDYEYMAPELVQILRERVGRAIPALATDGPS